MKRHPLISKGSLSRLLQEVAEAWRRQDYPRAILLLERATKLDPANSGLLFDLARAHGMRYEFDSAARCLDKAIALAPQKVLATTEAGRRAQEFGNLEMAQRYFEAGARLAGAPAEAFARLAELHERHARPDQASECVDRALALQPGYPPALLARARLFRFAGQLEAAEKAVLTLVENTSADAGSRARGWYELGAILDRQGRFDQAMEAFLKAKEILRPGARQFCAILEGIQQRLREMEQSISTEVLQRWQTAGDSLGPQARLAVLCGHPRSGTTLLEQVLDAHPGIVSSEETHILHDEAYLPLSRGFSPESSVLQVLEAAPPAVLQEARGNYFRFTELFLGKPIQGKLLVDKNPALSVLIPAVARIFPEAKFLVAIRDPRDVCMSCFMQPLALNPVSSSYLSLENTVSQYASVMGFWRTLLPRLQNPWIEVRYERIVEGLEVEARRALDFLGVEWQEEVLRFHEHARTRQVRSPSYAEVTKPVFKTAIGRWRNYEKRLAPFLAKLEPFLAAYGY